MNKYKMFLDDERMPPNDGTEWVICRSVEDAIDIIERRGCPHLISFDHDLGENEYTGMDFARWLVESDLNQVEGFLPKDFTFKVHSENVPGAKNISGLLLQYLSQRGR